MAGKTLIVSHVPILAKPFELTPVYFKSIQEAVNKAEDSDTILVKTGTYSENITILDKTLTIMGERSEGKKIIDGSKSPKNVPGIMIRQVKKTNMNVILDGLTIQNFDHSLIDGDSSGRGGGILVESNSSKIVLAVKYCVIYNNNGVMGGGGIFIDGVVANEAALSVLKVTHCTISSNNAAPKSGVYGGGIKNHGDATIEDSTIEKNTAGASGGGIASFDESYTSKLTIARTTIKNNTANGYNGSGQYAGGGVWCANAVIDAQSLAEMTGNTPDNYSKGFNG